MTERVGELMNMKEVKELIELVSEKGFAEFEIEHQGFRLHICRSKEPPVIQAAPPPVIIASSVPSALEPQAPAPQPDAVSIAPAPVLTPQAEAPSPEIQLRTIKS